MYAKIQINTVVKYPYTIAELKTDYPNISFANQLSPADLAVFGVVPVVVTSKPNYDELTQKLVEGAPIFQDGKWKQNWLVTPLDSDAISVKLTAVKSDMLIAIKRKRDILESSGFAYMGKMIDSDMKSIQRINTAVQAAQAAVAMSEPFVINWTTADNSALAMTGQELIGMSVAMTIQGNALHVHARALCDLVNQATTATDIHNIDIESGWPIQGIQ